MERVLEALTSSQLVEEQRTRHLLNDVLTYLNMIRLSKTTLEQDIFYSVTHMKLKKIHTDKDHHMAGEEIFDVVIDGIS